MIFKITEKEGLNYSKISGDKNKIHIDNLTGYNSIFGEKICHGTFVISKIFKKKQLKKFILSKNIFNIHIEFLDFIKYNKNLKIKSNKNKLYAIQDKKIKINILIEVKNISKFNDKKKKFLHSFNKKKINSEDRYNLILSLLKNISNYVGNTYPGKNSLIRSININFNTNNLLNKNNVIINSYKLNKRFPVIKNILLFKNYRIEFESLERPYVKKNKFFIKKKLKEKILNYKNNILIIGGSSGIGNDIFNLFKINKKIKKIITFNKNKVKKKTTNSLYYKVDVLKNLKTVNNLIKKYGPIKIFYFATTKIFFDKEVNIKTLNDYKKIFLNVPVNILKKNKKNIISIFYPSTSYIYDDKNSDYSRVKQLAETHLKSLCKKNKIIYKSVRFPALNSKQSISLLNPNPESFYQFISKHPKLVDKIF